MQAVPGARRLGDQAGLTGTEVHNEVNCFLSTWSRVKTCMWLSDQVNAERVGCHGGSIVHVARGALALFCTCECSRTCVACGGGAEVARAEAVVRCVAGCMTPASRRRGNGDQKTVRGLVGFSCEAKVAVRVVRAIAGRQGEGQGASEAGARSVLGPFAKRDVAAVPPRVLP